jgi:SAM-dependent methyltransferase
VTHETMYEDGRYLTNNQTWHEEDSQWKVKQILRMFKQNGMVPSSIAEIGCGAGEILRCLATEYGPAVTCSGYEISPQAFAICAAKEDANLHFSLGDPLEDGKHTFDVMMAIDVVEHVEDCFGFLRKLRRTGIYKLFHIPLDLSVQTVLRGSPLRRARSGVGHIHYFTKETALATLRDTGYEVVDHFYTQGSSELPNRGWKANLLKLPRDLSFSLHQDLSVRILGGCSLLVLAR